MAKISHFHITMPVRAIRAFHTGITPATTSPNRIAVFENGICTGNANSSSSGIQPIKGVITFAAPEVKSLCVSTWGGTVNSKGIRGYLNEVTPAQAQSASDAVNPFQGNTAITTFPEFQLFMGMTTLGFYRTVQHLTFSGCSSLSLICLPSSVIRLGTSSFEGTALTSIDLSHVRFIESKTFKDCTRLRSIIIPDQVQTMGNYTFQGCTALETVHLGRRVQYIGSYAFYLCSSLRIVTISSEVMTSIGNYAFRECPSLEEVIIPETVTSLGDGVFSYKKSPCGLKSFVIPKAVTSIGKNCFCTGSSALAWVKCLATTPPELGDNAFDTGADFPIYVPSGALGTYKVRQGWSDYQDRLLPLDDGM